MIMCPTFINAFKIILFLKSTLKIEKVPDPKCVYKIFNS